MFHSLGLYPTGGGFAARRAAEAAAEARQGKTAARNVKEELTYLEDRVDQLILLNAALWSLLEERLGLTEQELADRVQEIDLTDGTADGKITRGMSQVQPHHAPTPPQVFVLRTRGPAGRGVRQYLRAIMTNIELHVATDFFDEVHHTGVCYDERQIDELMAGVAKLGARRVEWIVDMIWSFYDEDGYPGGFDLLQAAVDAAHRHGLEFFALLKVFESAINDRELPDSWPQPEGACVVRDAGGLIPIVWPFVVEHPEYCLERMPGEWDPPGPVREICLVKGDTNPGGLRGEDLSIWTSETNGDWRRYDGPVTVSESVEYRPYWRWQRMSRVITLSGLDIPEGHRYIEIRVDADLGEGDFTNDAGSLVELIGPGGRAIPSTPEFADKGFVPGPHDWSKRLPLTRYGQMPEVQKLAGDPDAVAESFRSMRCFQYQHTRPCIVRLDERGRFAVARGKAERIPMLHPIYPEVRRHWCDQVTYCLDRGVDGINIRPTTHYKCHEEWAYGFNKPVLDACEGRVNLAAAARVNGDALTDFMREAAGIVHGRGRKFAVHVTSSMLRPDDEGRIPATPPMFEYQWSTWAREIADEIEWRGAFAYFPDNLRRISDEIALVARETGKPWVYQSNRRIVGFDGPHFALADDLAAAKAIPGVTAWQLYETANFTRLDDDGHVVFSPGIETVCRRNA
jgi:hypothetical protein